MKAPKKSSQVPQQCWRITVLVWLHMNQFSFTCGSLMFLFKVRRWWCNQKRQRKLCLHIALYWFPLSLTTNVFIVAVMDWRFTLFDSTVLLFKWVQNIDTQIQIKKCRREFTSCETSTESTHSLFTGNTSANPPTLTRLLSYWEERKEEFPKNHWVPEALSAVLIN